MNRDEAIAYIRANASRYERIGIRGEPAWLVSSVQNGVTLAPARPRASTSSKSVSLAEKKVENGDTEGAIATLNDLLKRTDLPDDVRALLQKARDRLVAGGDSAKKAAHTVASLTARVEQLKKSYAAIRGEQKETTSMGTRNQNTAREAQRAKLAERMGMQQDVPDVTLQQGAVVFGCISKADGRVLARMSPDDRRELAKATGAEKAKLWERAKAKVV